MEPETLKTLLFLFALLPFAHGADVADEAAELFRSAREVEALQSRMTGAFPAPCEFVSGISNPPPHMRVALTFDDGPDAATTPQVLATLQKYHATATFFLVGRFAQEHPELVQRILREGHTVIGNHTWNHPDFHKVPFPVQRQEILQNLSLLGSVQKPKFFRYPYGNATCESNQLLHSLGYRIVGWHVDSCDWGFNKTGTVSLHDAALCQVQPGNASNFVGHVLERLHFRGGGILLMHEIQPNTIRQLDSILARVVREGFTFGALSDLAFQPSMR